MPLMEAKGQSGVTITPSDSTQVAVNFSELPRQVEGDGLKTKELLTLAQDTTHIELYKNSITELEASVAEVVEQSNFFLQSYARPWLIQNLNAKWIRLNDDWVDLSVKISNSTETVEKRLRTCQELIIKWKKVEEAISGDSVSTSLNKPVGDLISDLTLVEHAFQKKIKIYLHQKFTLISLKTLQ